LISVRTGYVKDAVYFVMGCIIAGDAWVKAREHTHGKK